jgi:hypothetical protein
LAAPSVNFPGIGATGVAPPDPVGAVGPNHYIQMVNSKFAIYDKQGNALRTPVDIGSLWQNSTGEDECKSNYGDPIVVYDPLADRWLLSQFAIQGGAIGFHLCVAISKGSDPVTDGFFLYSFQTPVFPDFPKFGVWPNAYFVSTYENTELGAYALDRAAMLTGASAGSVRATLPALSSGRTSTRILPADLEGTNGPPAGSGNWFVRSVNGALQGGGANRLEIYEYKVDFAAGTSSLNLTTTLNTDPYDIEMCGTLLPRDCIPQPATTQKLDPLSNRLMMRLQYRNFGTYESLVTNQTVDVGNDRAGIRWYELRRIGGAWSINQQATYTQADDIHRWMGSAAADRKGNIAIGYSVSNATNVFPGLRYTFVPSASPQEALIVAGGGSQTGTPRWGDYSSMNLEPDGCTFWFTGVYYAATSLGAWQTRIASFTNPGCPDAHADYCRFVGNSPDVFFSCAVASGRRFGDYDVSGKPWSQGGLDPGYDNMPRLMADVNADGKPDYCRFVGNAPGIFLSCALQTNDSFGSYDVNGQAGYDAGYANQPRFLADVNGDGRADYCRFVGNAPNIFFSCGLATGNSFGNYDVSAKPWSQGGLDPGYDNMPRFMVDVNGDGKADYCRFVGNAPNIFLSCALSSGTGFGQYDVNSQPGYDAGYGNQPRFMADVNGDGRADYCRYVGNAPNIFFSCGLASGNSLGNYDVNAKPWSQGGLDPGYDNMPRFLVDVNGDKKADYCRFVGNSPKIFLSCAVSTGTGFGNYDVNGREGYDAGYGNMPRFLSSVIK